MGGGTGAAHSFVPSVHMVGLVGRSKLPDVQSGPPVDYPREWGCSSRIRCVDQNTQKLDVSIKPYHVTQV